MTFGFGNQHSIQLSYGRTAHDSTAQCEMTSTPRPEIESRQRERAGLATQVVIMFLAPDALLLRARSARYNLCFVSPVGMRSA